MIIEAEAGEFGDSELFLDDALGVIELKGPVVDAAFDAPGAVEERSLCGLKKLSGTRQEGFARMEELQFIAQSFFGSRAGEFGALEFAGGEVDKGEADDIRRGVLKNGRKEIVFFGVQNRDIGGGSRSDDADDFAADEFLAGAGLLHLIANG